MSEVSRHNRSRARPGFSNLIAAICSSGIHAQSPSPVIASRTRRAGRPGRAGRRMPRRRPPRQRRAALLGNGGLPGRFASVAGPQGNQGGQRRPDRPAVGSVRNSGMRPCSAISRRACSPRKRLRNWAIPVACGGNCTSTVSSCLSARSRSPDRQRNSASRHRGPSSAGWRLTSSIAALTAAVRSPAAKSCSAFMANPIGGKWWTSDA